MEDPNDEEINKLINECTTTPHAATILLLIIIAATRAIFVIVLANCHSRGNLWYLSVVLSQLRVNWYYWRCRWSKRQYNNNTTGRRWLVMVYDILVIDTVTAGAAISPSSFCIISLRSHLISSCSFIITEAKVSTGRKELYQQFFFVSRWSSFCSWRWLVIDSIFLVSFPPCERDVVPRSFRVCE